MRAKEGLEVTGSDRCDRPGMEARFANGGLVTPSDPAHGIHQERSGSSASCGSHRHSILKINPSAIPSIIDRGLRFLAKTTASDTRPTWISNIRIARLSLDVLRSIRETTPLNYDQTAHGTMRVFSRHLETLTGPEFPDLSKCCIELEGLRPMTPGDPVLVRRTPDTNLFQNTGHGPYSGGMRSPQS